MRYPGLSYGEYPGSKFAKGGVLGQIDVVPSTFPDEPIRLPSADLMRQTEIIDQTERPAMNWLLIGGAVAAGYLLFFR
ncbi:MAG: hypothetical protein GTN49_10785 [candidate division Zixibacteria bacterium]|nr:hypothetical protein [candidate division Zixibacteria bacterium]